MDVGSAAIAQMAREDTRWFVVAVIVLAFLLFLALPLSMMVLIDHLEMKAKTRAEVRVEIRKLRKLEEEFKARHELEKKVVKEKRDEDLF